MTFCQDSVLSDVNFYSYPLAGCNFHKIQILYGLPKQRTKGFIGGGKKVEMEGKWTIIKGLATNPNAIVYRLNDNKTNKTISFLKLNDKLLHLLDGDQHLMIGNAASSYTLNRIGEK